MKTKLLGLVVIIAAIALAGCNKSPQQSPPIKIGAVLPLTGNSALWGVPTKEGVELAAEIVNEKGGVNGRKIQISFEDSIGDPKTAISAVQKLLKVDHASAIIDNSNSSVTLAILPIINENHTVLLVTGASSPKITKGGPYKFRIWNSDALEGELIAKYVYSTMGQKRASILYVNNNYGQGLREVFTTAFTALEGIVVAEGAFTDTDTDFRSQIGKVIESDADVIYIVAYPKQGAVLLRQLKELNNTKKLVGAVAFEDAELFKQAGDATDGMIYPLPAPVDPSAQNYKEFVEAYKAKFKKDVPFLADVGFDGLNVLVEAIKRGGSDEKESIKQQLSKMPAYDGVSGPIQFDADGEVHKPFGIRVVTNGKPDWLERRVQE